MLTRRNPIGIASKLSGTPVNQCSMTSLDILQEIVERVLREKYPVKEGSQPGEPRLER
jgi:hypothetical protein